ncbi:MAG TPA: MFS transporter [Nocardioidaceae bacterium]|jgi:EmrB/QacA subfamily drug resistance transporter|nr:MFS transporter [Nocardioidaceae bacterium]
MRRGVLPVIALSLMTVVSAVSGLNVALPDLARDTGATQTQLTWIVDAYTVVFAGLLMFAGAVGDRFGRKGLLMAGLAVFGSAAGLAMTTHDPGTLIGLRALMGVGAAAIMPTTLSVITTSFDPEKRPRAIGVWVGVAGGGAVIGLFGTGILLEFFSWNSFFGLNVALAVLALIGTALVVPGSVDERPARLDAVGAGLSLVTVGGVVFGIIEGPSQGWTAPITVTALVVGVLAGVALAMWELRADDPMLDPRLFRVPGFSAGSLTVMVQFFASFGLFFIVLQYLQFVVGFSPLRAALALLPLPFVLIPLARNAPRLARRIGFGRVAPFGLLLTTAGLLVISRVTVDLSYWLLAAGLVVFAAGMGLAGTPATTAITESLPEAKQGVASAVNDTSRELGSALGIAILGSALDSGYRSGTASLVHGLPAPAAQHIQSSIAFTQSGQLDRLGPAAHHVVQTAEQAFVDGSSTALVVAAVIVAVTAAVVAVVGRSVGRPAPSHVPEPQGAAPR